MDAVLVVCYSYTGVSRRVAQLLCSHQGWPLGEVVDAHRRAGGWGTWRCVMDSLLHRRPAISYKGPDPADFHTVVLVSPIWMYRLAGPMRSFIALHQDSLRRVAVISTMGSQGASNAVAEVTHMVGRAPLHADAFTTREIEDGTCTGRLLAVGEALQPGAAPQHPMRPAAAL